MADIESAMAESRRERKKIERRRRRNHGKNIMACPIPCGDHNKK